MHYAMEMMARERQSELLRQADNLRGARRPGIARRIAHPRMPLPRLRSRS
jgi:hypothetical protein